MVETHKTNEAIVQLFKRVSLISSEGVNLGAMDSREALAMAESEGLDLVLVSMKDTPICKIFDYRKFVYNAKKKKVPKAPGISSIRFGLVTDVHDYNVKVRKIAELLEKGHKVMVMLRCKGRREMSHIATVGLQLVQKVAIDLSEVARVEQPPRVEGKMVKSLLSPLAKKN